MVISRTVPAAPTLKNLAGILAPSRNPGPHPILPDTAARFPQMRGSSNKTSCLPSFLSFLFHVATRTGKLARGLHRLPAALNSLQRLPTNESITKYEI